MTHAAGPFEVKVTPQPADPGTDARSARMNKD